MKLITRKKTRGNGYVDQEVEMSVINEPAVYKLAFRSNKPEADRFTNWVASEVLPTIRKTGKYEASKSRQAAPASISDSIGKLSQLITDREDSMTSDLLPFCELLGCMGNAINVGVRDKDDPEFMKKLLFMPSNLWSVSRQIEAIAIHLRKNIFMAKMEIYSLGKRMEA